VSPAELDRGFAGHARAAPLQLERRPAAEGAGADDDDTHRHTLRHAVDARRRRHHRQQDRRLEHVPAAGSHRGTLTAAAS